MCHVPPSKQKNSPPAHPRKCEGGDALLASAVENCCRNTEMPLPQRNPRKAQVAKVQHAQVSTNVAAHGQGLRASTKSFGTATSAIIRNAPGA